MSDSAFSGHVLKDFIAESDGHESVALDGVCYFTIEGRDTCGLLSAVLDDR
jgi:hypothetical protein